MLQPGSRLGPYEIQEPIGSGGMGEVYRARDPRLSREVAVKLITTDGTPSPDRLRRFETEARAAAQLSHPNVVTVHDVGTHEGHPYLVLELLEGETFREALRGGVPSLRQAVVWALEVSRGLAAAHDRGIVHRDLKPENVFLTTDGRVKILDFGLAKLREPLVSDEADRESPTATKDTSPGVLLGTVGYMSPEQVKGQTPDPRTDVFALGTVLFEMVTGRRAFAGDTAPEVLAAILRDEPPALESIQHGIPAALETVVRRCLAKRPTDRFSSGRALEAALETVLPSLEPSRASGARPVEARGPYPGLAAFTEADAERFFGREAEVEALWAKLRRGHLLAVIGPSGAGKTSFVRAGLIPARPSGWGAIVTTPGPAPMRGLAQALVGELPSDPDTTRQLLAFDDPEVAFAMVHRWRDAHLEGLLVVDQFEELFTLNPPEVQERFADLLGRLAGDGDVHLLLSLRDDFLIRCHEQKPLESVFLNLTPILALGGDDLLRALTEPANREGFAFEGDALVAEMLESVEGTRGALPLLAFAVSRLWEKRDREKKLLTRKAYEEIGGVAGALAQHAEQTLERIGLEREPLVRELFRNLVTAQWTRAAANREELLSVLPDREAGAQVLDHLIDARLLTSYEIRDTASHRERGVEESHAKDLMPESGAPPRPAHRIEIVHESLLRAWPRLVRWQAQDEEGAVLRDQLRQAAHLWKEKSRSPDLLWTGDAFQEFQLWRRRYPGRLTALEEDYATALAERARRQRRRRHLVTTSVVAAALAVAAVTGALWWRAERSREEARLEARRAEGAHLHSLAQQRLEEHPTEALAYATASLELADRPEVRRLALEALWQGPTELSFPFGVRSPQMIDFSPDGRWLAAETAEGRGALWPSDGGSPTHLEGSEVTLVLRFSPKGDLVAGQMDMEGQLLGLWSVPEGRLRHSFSPAEPGGTTGWFRFSPDGQRIITFTTRSESSASEHIVRSWPIGAGDVHLVARLPIPFESALVFPDVDPAWSRLAWAAGPRVHIAPLERTGLNTAAATTLEHDGVVTGVFFDEQGRRLATSTDLGETIWIWSLEHEPPELIRTSATRGWRPGAYADGKYMRFDQTGSMLAGKSGGLWDLNGPPEAAALRVQGCSWELAFEPTGPWLATGCNRVSLWPLSRPYPHILTGHTRAVRHIAFTPDGRRLVSTSLDNSMRVWSLGGGVAIPSRTLHQNEGALRDLTVLAMAPDGSFVASGDNAGRVLVFPLDGRPPRELSGFSERILTVAVGPEGRLVAAGSGALLPKDALVRVWDLSTDEVQVLDAGDGKAVRELLGFTGDGELEVLSGPPLRIRRWQLGDSAPHVVREIDLSSPEFGGGGFLDLTTDGHQILIPKEGRMWTLDLGTHAVRDVGRLRHPTNYWVEFDSTDRLILAKYPEGIVGVASATGGEPHLLLRHEGRLSCFDVSPDGRWIATGGEDGTIRLWPMPDLSKAPLQTLPRADLLAKLRSLTNLRAARNPESPTGWAIELGPFPGWEEVPTW